MEADSTYASLFFGWILDACGHDPLTLNVVATLIIGNIAYLIGNILFVGLDFIDPQWVQPYRIQDGESKKVSFPRWVAALKVVYFNLIVVGGGMALIYHKIGRIDSSPVLPSLWQIMPQFIFFFVCEEIGFYYTHRTFHHRWFYKSIHKRHHEWTSPVSITSVYAHPLEHAISNVLPAMAGPVLLGSHIMVAWAWWTMAILTTTVSHSGYHLPFTPSAEAHDYHHLAFNECFGVMGWLDSFHGTNKTFKESARFARHHTTWTLQPVKEQFPDKAE